MIASSHSSVKRNSNGAWICVLVGTAILFGNAVVAVSGVPELCCTGPFKDLGWGYNHHCKNYGGLYVNTPVYDFGYASGSFMVNQVRVV
jgi:hypothetical protein